MIKAHAQVLSWIDRAQRIKESSGEDARVDEALRSAASKADSAESWRALSHAFKELLGDHDESFKCWSNYYAEIRAFDDDDDNVFAAYCVEFGEVEKIEERVTDLVNWKHWEGKMYAAGAPAEMRLRVLSRGQGFLRTVDDHRDYLRTLYLDGSRAAWGKADVILAELELQSDSMSHLIEVVHCCLTLADYFEDCYAGERVRVLVKPMEERAARLLALIDPVDCSRDDCILALKCLSCFMSEDETTRWMARLCEMVESMSVLAATCGKLAHTPRGPSDVGLAADHLWDQDVSKFLKEYSFALYAAKYSDLARSVVRGAPRQVFDIPLKTVFQSRDAFDLYRSQNKVNSIDHLFEGAGVLSYARHADVASYCRHVYQTNEF